MFSLTGGWRRNTAIAAVGIAATMLVGTAQVNSLNAPMPLPQNLPQAAEKGDRLDRVSYQRPMPSLNADQRGAVETAVETFVWGLSNKEPKAVWVFATEFEQSRLGTEEAAYQFFSKIHPPLVHAKRIQIDSVALEGELTRVTTYVRDRIGIQWSAEFSLFQDDAGDWKIVDCELSPAPGVLI
ncbi:hypothetical protein [Afifella pfennigii]|uniref:hypothetical protein n=1 Tax=Afifella pfennigii TaxID=209897 RepID=UPI0005510143|nr:hypothetical protein [Afifella pfennigii]